MTIVEFAFLSPIMLFLICGAVEIGHQIFARQVLEGSVMEAARAATATLESSEAERIAVGSGLIGHSQKMTVAARATAEKKTVGQRS
ncbi:pilus assembly protein [Roseomonas aeriglobus]|nr:pilus assembly protein [Roseomonas aeriglobus]